MARTHLYWGIEKLPAMPQAAWDRIITAIEGNSPGTEDRRENRFQTRYNIVPQDPDQPDKFLFTKVIYEANFDDLDISLERIRVRLVSAFNLADNRVTFATTSTRFAVRSSGIVTYKLDAANAFRSTLFGRLNDTKAVSWVESMIECWAYLAANSQEWNGQ